MKSRDQSGSDAGRLLGVWRGADKHTLVFSYENGGVTNEQRILMTTDISEYHYCSFYGSLGFAFAIADTNADIYWAVRYFRSIPEPIHPQRIATPAGYKLAGIAAHPFADNFYITAIKTPGEKPGTIQGWVYAKGCPAAINLANQAPSRPVDPGLEPASYDRLAFFETPSPEFGRQDALTIRASLVKLAPLAGFKEPYIPIGVDPRFAATMKLDSIAPVDAILTNGMLVTFGIHSPARLFGGAGEGTNYFRLEYQTNGQARIFTGLSMQEPAR